MGRHQMAASSAARARVALGALPLVATAGAIGIGSAVMSPVSSEAPLEPPIGAPGSGALPAPAVPVGPGLAPAPVGVLDLATTDGAVPGDTVRAAGSLRDAGRATATATAAATTTAATNATTARRAAGDPGRGGVTVARAATGRGADAVAGRGGSGGSGGSGTAGTSGGGGGGATRGGADEGSGGSAGGSSGGSSGSGGSGGSGSGSTGSGGGGLLGGVVGGLGSTVSGATSLLSFGGSSSDSSLLSFGS